MSPLHIHRHSWLANWFHRERLLLLLLAPQLIHLDKPEQQQQQCSFPAFSGNRNCHLLELSHVKAVAHHLTCLQLNKKSNDFGSSGSKSNVAHFLWLARYAVSFVSGSAGIWLPISPSLWVYLNALTEHQQLRLCKGFVACKTFSLNVFQS